MNKYLLRVGNTTPEQVPVFWIHWLLAGCLTFGLGGAADAQMPPARVIVAKVQRREIDTGHTFVGTVVPLRTSTVASAVEGLVEELRVRDPNSIATRHVTVVRQGDRVLSVIKPASPAQSASPPSESDLASP